MSDYTGPELCALTATEAVAALEAGEVSAAELLEAALARIEAVEPAINALPTICADRARAHIGRLERGAEKTWLAGLPIAIKDLTRVAGVRWTDGTKAHANRIADSSSPIVEVLERRGGVVVAKSNTPEMGAGGNTFNEVFGRTLNPWNTALNPGGSSGGAAAALATGEVWLAHGSDLGGSLRTPAAYCGVVGLRPSPGRAGGATAENAFSHVSVQGPMARTVEDCALFLDAMTGFDPRMAISLEAPATSFVEAVRAAEAPARVAFAPDLGGFGPVEPEVADLLAAAMSRLEGVGTVVEDAGPALPDLTDLAEAYYTLRAMVWATGPGSMPQEVQKHFKRTLAENIALGWSLTAREIVAADRARSALYLAMEAFMAPYDALACPVVGLPSQPTEVEYPTEIAGQKLEGYMDWLRFSFLSSTTALPAISVPVGLTANGAPMGIQLIGKPRGEAKLLQVARMIEATTGGFGRPIDPIVAG